MRLDENSRFLTRFPEENSEDQAILFDSDHIYHKKVLVHRLFDVHECSSTAQEGKIVPAKLA